MARRFVIVEGDSDAAVLMAWARRIGVDLSSSQVQIVPSGGYSSAERVSSFLSLAYEGADVVVVLDNGSQAPKTRLEIEARFGERVRVAILSRTDIEGFFVPDAVTTWLRIHGIDEDGLSNAVASRLMNARGGRIRALEGLARDYLGRSYSKVDDGRAIADLTTEVGIDPEIKKLIVEFAAE